METNIGRHGMNPRDYQRIEKALGYIAENYRRQPSLDEIAGEVALSPYHFNRLFKQWAGITPKQYLMYVTLQAAKGNLNGRASVLEAAIESGLSGPGRLHDLFVTVEAVTPGEYKSGGRDLVLRHGIADSPFGPCFVGVTERGLCRLAFADDDKRAELESDLANRWPRARLERDDRTAARLVRRIFEPDPDTQDESLRLLIKGTNFQMKVWRALLDLEPGELTTYSEIARRIGQPGATRAVGNAVGRNELAFVIPCHRVLRADGALGGYRWGPDRKRAILAWEAVHAAAG